VGGPYPTVEASSRALRERALEYPDLHQFMPTDDAVGMTVIDYGCGPGHDTILFLLGGADRVRAYDKSQMALDTTRARLTAHGLARCATVHFPGVPLPKADRVHCAGVLHHIADPHPVLVRLAKALRPDAHLNLMVYDGDESEHWQSDVPVTHWWTKRQVADMAAKAGLEGQYVGGYPCEAPWRQNCVAACYRMWPA
jgi:trans-aconitate methyltransferase